MVKLPTLVEMLKAGVHFGHQKSRWHPKMEKFIFTTRNNVHIIDLEKTSEELNKALDYVKNLTSSGKVILFVGTKHQAKELIKNAATSCGAPYVTERWIGGLLTNFNEVKRRLKKYRELKEQVATGEIEKYTKKEQSELKKKLEKMERYLSGLIDLKAMPDALYIADMRVDKTALSEAARKKVPVVAVSDSNTNPEKVTRAIPANDDAVNSIKIIVDLIAEAVKEGKLELEKKQLEVSVAKKPEVVRKERKAQKKEESL